MTPPEGVTLYQGDLGTYWFDDDGILNSISKPPKRTIENTRRNVELIKRITGGKRVPLLVYICNSPIPDKATRDFVAESVPTIYSAMAMVSTSGLGKIIMNVLYRFRPPGIPMKAFNTAGEARDWLKHYVEP